MTIKDFLTSKKTIPKGGKYLGCWKTVDVVFIVFGFPNGSKLRLTYWTCADQLLVCVKDKKGVYNCIGNNIKDMEAAQHLLDEFDWRKYDAKQEKRITNGLTSQNVKVTEEDMADIRKRLNSL